MSVALTLVAPLPAAAQGGPVPAPIASTTIIGVEMGEPEYEFSHILAVAFLPGDRIAASAAQSTDVRVFTLDGRHVMTLGRGGGGPGEFVGPFAISGTDSIIQVFDAMQHRVVQFSNDGEHLETSRLPTVPGHNLTQVVQLSTGPVVGATTPAFAWGQRMHQTDVVAIHLDPGGALDTLARFHASATVWYTPGARGPWSLAYSRFGAAGAWAARDSIVAVADGYTGIVRFLEARASGGLTEVGGAAAR